MIIWISYVYVQYLYVLCLGPWPVTGCVVQADLKPLPRTWETGYVNVKPTAKPSPFFRGDCNRYLKVK